MALDCTFDSATYCVTCPELPAIAGVPGRVEIVKSNGWNAGANSIAQLDGDLHAVFSVDTLPGGIVAGLKASRANQIDPNAMLFGFYVYASGPSALIKILERSITRYGPMPYTPTTSLEIRRTGGAVNYFIGGTHVYRSPTLSSGKLLFSTCLYGSGDTF